MHRLVAQCRWGVYEFSAVLILLILFSPATRLSAAELNPIVTGGIRDAAPTNGQGDEFMNGSFIGWTANGQYRALAEYDLSTFGDRKLIYAVLTGGVGPNNSFNTGTRNHKLEVYSGNGALELSDYSAPGVELKRFSHTSGGHTYYNVEFTDYLQGRLDAQDSHLGMRISPLSNPMAFDVLSSSFPPAYIEYAVYPMGGNTVRFLPKFDVNVSSEAGGPYVLLEGEGGVNVYQNLFSGIDRRGVIEYDISSIPAGAIITGAKIMFDVNSISGGPDALAYGYAGDGVASIADALQVDAEIGLLRFPFHTGSHTADLKTEFIQSLVGKSKYLGINLVGGLSGGSLGFYTDEWHTSPYFGLPAQLFIQYTAVPEQAISTYVVTAFFALFGFVRNR